MPKLRVLLADGSAKFRELLRSQLDREPQTEIVAEAENGREAIQLAWELKPDVILLDVALPELDGIHTTYLVRTLLPHARILGLSLYDNRCLVEAMLEAGASAYLMKDGDYSSWIQAITSPEDAPRRDALHE